MSTRPADRDTSTSQTDDVTHSTIGPSITISPPEQQSGNNRSGDVNRMASIASGDSDSRSSARKSRPSPIPVPPRKQSNLVVEDGVEGASGPLLKEKGAGYDDVGIKEQGTIVFRNLESSIAKLDKNLQNFTNAVGQLGSSAALRLAADDFRHLLEELFCLFRKNASELFGDIDQDLTDDEDNKNALIFYKGQLRFRTSSSDQKPAHDCFSLLADRLNKFLSCLNRFPEFTDEVVIMSVKLFIRDLEYWEFCLKEHNEQYRTQYFRLYLYDVSAEIGERLANISQAVAAFTDNGVPAIQYSQSRLTGALQNLSTVATLFSSVTATTISFSYQNFKTRTQEAVNLLWIISLLFSLAIAMNSQLAFHWHSATYRSPVARLPPWVSVWIMHTPLSFLIASVITFLAGLVCFTFSNFNVSPFIPVLTTICTSISSIALLTIGFWSAGERYICQKTKGRKSLADAIDEAPTSFIQACLKFCCSVLEFRLVWISRRPHSTASSLQTRSRSTNSVYSWVENGDPTEDIEKSPIPRAVYPKRNGTEGKIINREPEDST